MQITIRGIDPELDRVIRRLSKDEGISLNKAALRLLAKGANFDRPTGKSTIGDDLDHLFGTWSAQEAERFLGSIEPCRRIDEDFWK